MKRHCCQLFLGLSILALFVAVAGCSTRSEPKPRPRSQPMAYTPPPSYMSAPVTYYLPPAGGDVSDYGAPLVEPFSSAAPYEAIPNPAPSWQAASGKTVILDAGHGGADAGACHFGLQEKDINLDLAMRTANLLRSRGCNVIMTRSSDATTQLSERSAVANRYPNATLVSIHVNASEGNPGVTGVESFILSQEFSNLERGRIASSRFRANGTDSVQGKQALANLAVQSRNRGPALANSLQRSLAGRLGEADRGVKQRDLHVLRETYFGPAALVEVGFLTNPRTADRMRTDEWRRRTSEALCEGISNFLQQPM